MSEPIAEAFVLVRPNLLEFEAALRLGVAKATAKVIAPVRVVPNVTGFQAALRAAIKTKTLAPISIPVRPRLTGTFTSDLRRQIAARVVTPIPVPVVAVPTAVTGAAAAATTAGGAGAQTAAAASTATAARSVAAVNTATVAATSSQRGLGSAVKATTKTLQDQSHVAGQAARDIDRFSRGVAATGLSLFGLRGATLAASGAFLIGAAGVTAFAKAVGAAVGFQRQLSVFQATTGATSAELKQVSLAAKALGADLTLPGVSASDAAEAMTELAKAGLSVQDAIAGARGVLQLATAANISNADATQLAANALNAFNLQGAKATVVADTLANAANAAQGSIVDIGVAFGQAAAVGHQVGLSFQDTTVFLTALARAGLTSSDAGTSLRTALIRLINPTKKAKIIFSELGLSLRDAQGNLRPEFFSNLGAALEGLTKKQRDLALAQIGGQDAIRALSILSKLSTRDLIALRDELAKQGTAADLAAARTKGLAGAGSNLSNTIENLSINLGSKVTPSLTAFTNALTGAITGIAASPLTPALGQAIAGIADGFQHLATAASAIPPILAPIVSLLASISGAIGPANILAAAAAFVILRKAILGISAGTTVNAFTGLGIRAVIAKDAILNFTRVVRLAAGFGGLSALRAALQLTAAGFVGFATSATGIAIGIAAVTAGLFFLITRETSVARTTRILTESTNRLADANSTLTGTTQALASAQSALNTDGLAVTTARLAVEEARAELASSVAAKGSLARRQLTARLAVALDSLRLAQQQLIVTQKQATDQAVLLAAAQETQRKALNKQRDAILDNIRARQQDLRLRVASESIVAQRAAITPEEQAAERAKEAFAVRSRLNKQLSDDLNRQAAALRATGDLEKVNEAARFTALARLIPFIKNFPRQIPLILNTTSLQAGLKALEADFRKHGNDAAAAFVEGMLSKFNPHFFVDLFNNALNPLLLRPVAQAAGADAGAAFVTSFSQQLKRLGGQVAGFNRKILLDQIAGNTGQELADLQAQQKILERGLAKAQAKGSEAGILNFGTQLKANLDAQQAIRDKAKSDAAAAAAKAKADAAAIQKSLDDADTAFVNALSFKQGVLFDIRSTRAERTKSLADDIGIQVDLQAFFTQMIALAKKTIHSAVTLATTLQSLRVAREQALTQQKALEQQQRDNIRQAIIDKRDRQEESLNLDVQIAQTKHNNAQELKAHRALLAYLKERQKHADRGSLEWKRLQAKIETENAAIRDLTKSKKEQAAAFASASFEFLQAQQGFAATILGNLLPLNALKGAVGGGSGGGGGGGSSFGGPAPAGFATAVHVRGPSGGGGGGIIGAAPGPADFATAAHTRGPGVGAGLTSAARTQATAGASHAQLSTLIHIQREMLRVLAIAAGRSSHPEAAHNQRTVGREWEAAWS